MRIISGTHGGRPIRMPNEFSARPTTDFAKTALFNILNNSIDYEEITVLDLFSGTGSISYEFASRGAKLVELVEMMQDNYSFICKTIQALKFNNIRPYRADAFVYLKKSHNKYDVIFADPPYTNENIIQIPDLVFENGLLLPDGVLIIEHSSKIKFEEHPHFRERRSYGRVNFSFFR